MGLRSLVPWVIAVLRGSGGRRDRLGRNFAVPGRRLTAGLVGVHRRSAMSASLKGFGCRPFADARGPTGAGVRKPRKEETAGRKRRGLVGGELWGFEGRGRIAGGGCGGRRQPFLSMGT